MYNLRIDSEFQSLIPPLSEEEFQQLEENIKADGCRDALVTWNGIIVDGHNRYKICQKNKLPYNVEGKEFANRTDAIEWIIRNQFGRRNLSPTQRCELALKLKPLIQEKAKENKLIAMAQARKSNPNNKNEQFCQNSDKTVDTKKELAKIAGVSHDTMTRVEKILDHGTPDQINRARKGGKGNSVNAIYKEVINKPEPQPEPTLPKEEMKVCSKCGELLPLTMFHEKRNECKSCVNKRAEKTKKQRDWKGDVITISPEYAHLTEEEIIGDLYNIDKEVIHTIEDGIRDFTCNFDTFLNTLDSILEDYTELLKEPENNKKMMAALSEAVTAMTNLKGKYSYERL